MNINYHEGKQMFQLNTKNSSYLMKVVTGGFLAHLYYGGTILTEDLDYVLFNYTRGMSPNPVEAAGDRSFSLDTLPLEFPCYGIGDFRPAAIMIELADGSTATDLRYVSHRIYKGKRPLEGLPYVGGTENEVESLEITMEDDCSKAVVTLCYSVYYGEDVITRSCIVENRGEQEVQIKRVLSASIDFLEADLDFIYFYGRHECERNMGRERINHAKLSVESLRGASSAQQNPFIIVADKSADDFQGRCYGFHFVYSGNFLCEAVTDQTETTRVNMGIHPTDFSWLLEPGEHFCAPEAVMVFSEHGFNQMSDRLHRLYRRNLCRGIWKTKRRPVLLNSWEAVYFDFDGQKLIELAKEAKDTGIELIVMDDGWFGKRCDDSSSLGDWEVNEEKLGMDLKSLVQKINETGLKFGIWYEPEMISKESGLYCTHTDWCLHVQGRNQTVSRGQLVLDMSREDVRDYLFKTMEKVLSGANIEYVKWDMNRNITEAQSAVLPAKRQREVWHRYILGVYDLLERLTRRFPNILWEGCASGGGRFDPGMLYYFPQIWTSDDTDAVERLKIQCGTSYGYPVSCMGSHVSAVPNHQTNRDTPLETRGFAAMSGCLGYELDVSSLPTADKQMIKVQIEDYKKYYGLIHEGTYTRIENPYESSNFSVWGFSDEGKHELLVFCVQIRSVPNPPVKFIKVPMADERKNYIDEETGAVYSGSVLKKVGFLAIPGILSGYASAQGKERSKYLVSGDGVGLMKHFIEKGEDCED